MINEDSVQRETSCCLSVLVPVYNHEKYIRQCIDSIRMQKVDFSMEVWIAEDASTDGSRQILQNMEMSGCLPGFFHFLYRKENLGMRRNGEDLYRRAGGKYVIVLEGDDYWTYDRKLQKQVDFLERHPEFTASAHRTEVVDDNGVPVRGGHYPECRHRIYTFRDWCLFRLPGQTAAVMFRSQYIRNGSFLPADMPECSYPRDQIKAFCLSVRGNIYCFPEKWSAYRYHPETGSSFSGGAGIPWTARHVFYTYARLYAMEQQQTRERIWLSIRIVTDYVHTNVKRSVRKQ